MRGRRTCPRFVQRSAQIYFYDAGTGSRSSTGVGGRSVRLSAPGLVSSGGGSVIVLNRSYSETAAEPRPSPQADARDWQ